MPRRQSYSSYSSYLQERKNDQCCTGGGGTSITNQPPVSSAELTALKVRVTNLELSFSDVSYHEIILDISNINASLGTFVTSVSGIDSSLTEFYLTISGLEFSLNQIWLDFSFNLLNQKFTDLSTNFYNFLSGDHHATHISAGIIHVDQLFIRGDSYSPGGTQLIDISLDMSFANIDISENLNVLKHAYINELSVNKLSILNTYTITLSGEEFDIRDISRVAYGVSQEFYPLKASFDTLSGHVYEISTNLILLQNNVIIADASISYLEEKTTALESHSGIVDTSIIDLYSDITLVQTVAGLQQSNINSLDRSVNTIEDKVSELESHNSTSFNTLSGHVYEISALAYGVSQEFYPLKANFNTLSGHVYEISTVAYGVSQDFYPLKASFNTLSGHVYEISALAYGVSSEYHAFISLSFEQIQRTVVGFDTSITTTTISATEIDVSNLKIQGTNIDTYIRENIGRQIYVQWKPLINVDSANTPTIKLYQNARIDTKNKFLLDGIIIGYKIGDYKILGIASTKGIDLFSIILYSDDEITNSDISFILYTYERIENINEERIYKLDKSNYTVSNEDVEQLNVQFNIDTSLGAPDIFNSIYTNNNNDDGSFNIYPVFSEVMQSNSIQLQNMPYLQDSQNLITIIPSRKSRQNLSATSNIISNKKLLTNIPNTSNLSSAITQEIDIEEGFNMISTYINIVDTTVFEFQMPFTSDPSLIAGEYLKNNGNTAFYTRMSVTYLSDAFGWYGSDTINYIFDNKKGYIFYAKQPKTLIIEGKYYIQDNSYLDISISETNVFELDSNKIKKDWVPFPYKHEMELHELVYIINNDVSFIANDTITTQDFHVVLFETKGHGTDDSIIYPLIFDRTYRIIAERGKILPGQMFIITRIPTEIQRTEARIRFTYPQPNNFVLPEALETTVTTLNKNVTDNISKLNNVETNLSTIKESITTIYSNFEDYFTKKPYKLLDPSYEKPILSNNNIIRLSWSIPDPYPKKAALNFIGSSHGIEGTEINLANIDSDVITLLTANKIDLTNYNYLPYFDSVNIDYRKYSNPGTWVTLSTSELRLNDANGVNKASPELYPHTEMATIQLGTGNKIGTYDFSNDTLIYKNENLFPINSEQYQFRIYLKNQNDDPITSYIDSHGVSGPLWSYLYIPTSSGEWISLPTRGAATAPLSIILTLQGGSNKYRNLSITGANNNPNPINPQSEIGLKTLFTELSVNSLYVNYGFDLSGSRSSLSKQAIPVDSNFANIFQSYESNNLTINTWNIKNDFSLASVNDPMLTSNTIIFPGYTYELSGYYMKINTDESLNVYTTQYPSPTSYPVVTISGPDRTDVTTDVTSGTTNYDDFVNLDTSFSNTDIDSGYIISTAYPNNSNLAESNIHFVDPDNSFQLSSNTTHKLICAKYRNDTTYGIDLSGQELCYFKFSTNASVPIDLSGAIRKGFTTNDSAETPSNTYFEFTQSETKDAANITETGITAAEQYRRQGWYLGVDLQDLKVKNIMLANYPDICNNSYNPWNINFQQISATGSILGYSTYDLKIAQKPTQDISLTNYTISHDLSSIKIFKDFFGLKHIYDTITITIAGEFINLNPYWRTATNITHDSFKLKIDGSTQLDTQDISWPTGGVTTVNFTETLIIQPNDFTHSSRDYSRILSNHFSIDSSHKNNVTRSPSTYTIDSQNIKFYGKDLLWDYTWEHLTGNKNSLPNSNWSSEIVLMNIGSGLYPDSINNFSSFNTVFSHSDKILDNQLMWAYGGYKSGNYITTSDHNPYINYNNYYNNSQDYSSYNNSGVLISVSDFTYTSSPGSSLIGTLLASDLAGTYKWIVFKAIRSNASGNINVNVYSTSNTGDILTLGQDYLLYVLEDNDDLGIGSLRTGWKSAQLQFNSGLSAQLNNQDGAGAYNGNNVDHPIEIFSSRSGITIYYRVALKNSSNQNIHHITIDYE